jgi:mRNA interferase RelE/StbE
MSNGRFELRITPAAQKEIDRLPKQARERVEVAILSLVDNPRPRGSKKLRGLKDTYRIRVGNYRVVYRVHDDELVILVVAVGDRKDIYRG